MTVSNEPVDDAADAANALEAMTQTIPPLTNLNEIPAIIGELTKLSTHLAEVALVIAGKIKTHRKAASIGDTRSNFAAGHSSITADRLREASDLIDNATRLLEGVEWGVEQVTWPDELRAEPQWVNLLRPQRGETGDLFEVLDVGGESGLVHALRGYNDDEWVQIRIAEGYVYDEPPSRSSDQVYRSNDLILVHNQDRDSIALYRQLPNTTEFPERVAVAVRAPARRARLGSPRPL